MGQQSKAAKALGSIQTIFQGVFSVTEQERLNRTITNGMIREAKSKMATALGKEIHASPWAVVDLEMRCNAWRIIITKQLKALGKGASKARMRQVFRSVSGLPPSPERTNPRWESSEKLIEKSFIAWCKLGRPTPISLINELLSPELANKPKHNSNKEQTLPGCDHIPHFLPHLKPLDKDDDVKIKDRNLNLSATGKRTDMKKLKKVRERVSLNCKGKLKINKNYSNWSFLIHIWENYAETNYVMTHSVPGSGGMPVQEFIKIPCEVYDHDKNFSKWMEEWKKLSLDKRTYLKKLNVAGWNKLGNVEAPHYLFNLAKGKMTPDGSCPKIEITDAEYLLRSESPDRKDWEQIKISRLSGKVKWESGRILEGKEKEIYKAVRSVVEGYGSCEKAERKF